jgi:electron-transferring-flavoprotein dehydrogenase
MTDKLNHVSVLIVGAGPAGLTCAISLRRSRPDLDVCVIEKAAQFGNHNLSGAVLESPAITKLLDSTGLDWRSMPQSKEILSQTVTQDDVLFLPDSKHKISMNPMIAAGAKLKLSFGQILHRGDYIISLSKLTKWLAEIATQLGAEVITGFAAEDITLDGDSKASGIKLVDQGRDRDGKPQPNFVPGEIISADFIVLAEGCDGLVTEKFIAKAGLTRTTPQLYSVGIKEVIKVSPEQYRAFGDARVIHAMGYPIWTPLLGPNMFGGGLMYSYGNDHICAGMIVGADWKYADFNPQDALTHFKNHSYIRRFIENGKVVAAGAKMIPEGGYCAIPRNQYGHTGNANVLILGDSAGLVNMNKIKGLHNAIDSGVLAAGAVTQSISDPAQAAGLYTALLDNSGVGIEMLSARNFRQTVAKLGPTLGFPLSIISNLLRRFKMHEDYEAMTRARYKFKGNREFDKDTFTAMAGTHHREDQPCHLLIGDPQLCKICKVKFNSPCVTFCPAGVYETIGEILKPANPSNCLHCKTCQRKCPFDNIRWTAPEGTGGPRYTNM